MDPTDGPDTSEIEERAREQAEEGRGGAVAHNDDADLLAKLDKFDEDHADAERAKKKAKQERAAAKGKDDDKPKPKAKKDDDGESADDDDKDEAEDDEKAKKDDDERPAARAKDDDDEKPAADDDKDDAPGKAKEREIPSKALEAIARERARAHADVANARAEVVKRERAVQDQEAQIRAKWEPVAENQKQIDILGSRVKTSARAAVQLLKRLGAAHWEDIANYAISQTDNPKITPEFKRQYTLDDGGASTEVEELRRKQHELEQRLERADREKKDGEQRAEYERRELAHADELIKHAGDKHPFIAAAAKNNPKLLKAGLRALTQEMYVAGGKTMPSHEQVVVEFERRRREEAAAYGLPLPTKKKPIAGENETARDLAPTSRARAALDDDEDDDHEDAETREARIRRKLDEMDEEERLRKKASRRK